jgi:EAL domain-containing protein (putative c-di-GMP-specific phosphodiesterase class I)
MVWVARIHKAVEEDRCRLYFQSIIPVNGPLANDHFEVLLRMIDEEGKIVPPMAFLPAAQRYDLMPMIDRWVIKEALAYCAACYGGDSERQLDTIAINISAAALMDTRFAAYVQEHIVKSGLPAARVCFEITETAAIMNLATAVAFMERLKVMGCRFALDDFGSGMSSFTYLKNLPVDYLKIDGSFVRDMLTDPIDCAMVEAINKIGHTMSLKTIAEFVENEGNPGQTVEIGVDCARIRNRQAAATRVDGSDSGRQSAIVQQAVWPAGHAPARRIASRVVEIEHRQAAWLADRYNRPNPSL